MLFVPKGLLPGWHLSDTQNHKRWRFYTHMFLLRQTFTHKGLAQRSLSTNQLLEQTLLHRHAFAHRSSYTKKLLNRKAFSRKSLHTQRLLQTRAFTQRSWAAFIHRCFYKQPLYAQKLFTQTRLHTGAITHKQGSSWHTEAFTHRTRKTGELKWPWSWICDSPCFPCVSCVKPCVYLGRALEP